MIARDKCLNINGSWKGEKLKINRERRKIKRIWEKVTNINDRQEKSKM